MSLLTGMVPSANLTRAKRSMEGSGLRTVRLLDHVKAASPLKDVPKPAEVVAPVRPTGIERVRALLLAQRHLSVKAIADQARATKPLVYMVRRMLIDSGALPEPPRQPSHVANHEPLLAALRADPTRTIKSIADELGVPYSTLISQRRALEDSGRVRAVRIVRYEVVDA